MNSRNTLVMLVVAVVLVGAAYMMKDTAPRDFAKGTPTPTPPPLFSPAIAISDVVQVSIDNTAGTAMTMTHGAGTWQVNGQPADDQVDGMINRIISPTVETAMFDRKPEDYGFGSPQLTITIKAAADRTYVLIVGDDAAADPSVFVRVNGEGPIFVLNNGDINQLKTWVDVPPYAPTATPPPTDVVTGTVGTTETLGSDAVITTSDSSPIIIEPAPAGGEAPGVPPAIATLGVPPPPPGAGAGEVPPAPLPPTTAP